MKTYKVKICNKEIEISKTRGRAIKAYCTDCSAGERVEVRECPCTMCPLYIYRGYIDWKGTKKPQTEEQKAIGRERMRIMRLKQANNHSIDSKT
jgi:hypothetical protein